MLQGDISKIWDNDWTKTASYGEFNIPLSYPVDNMIITASFLLKFILDAAY